MSRKKNLVLILLLFLLLSGFFLQDIIISTCFQWYLKGYSRVCLGGKLKYDAVHRNVDGIWIFDHPVIITPQSLDNGGYHFHADQLSIDVAISWLDRKIDLGIAIEHPHLDIGKGAEELKRIFNRSSDEFGLFHVHTHLEIPQGSVHMHDLGKPLTSPVSFSVVFSKCETCSGIASLWMDEASKQTPAIQMTFADSKEQPFEISLNVLNLEGSSLWHFIGIIWPQLQGYEMSQGIVSGEIKITLPKETPPVAKGLLVANEVIIEHINTECKIYLPKATLHLNSNSEYEVSFSSGGSIVQWRYGKPLWTLEIQGGTLHVNPGKDTSFSMDTYFSDSFNSRRLSFDSHMNGEDHGDSSTKLSIGMHLYDPELEMLPDSSKNTDVHNHFVQLSVSSLNGHWDSAEVAIQGLGQGEFAFFQHLLSYYYPNWHQFQVYKGSVDANMLVNFHGWKISHIAIKQFALHNLEFGIEQLAISGGVNEASGHLSFDLNVEAPVNSPFETLQADLKTDSGYLTLVHADSALWQFTDIDANLVIRHGVLQSSSLKGIAAGLKGSIILDGSLSEPQVTLEFNGNANKMAHAFPASISRAIAEQFGNDHVKILAKAVKYTHGLLFQGKAYIHHKSVQDDELSFGFSLERPIQNTWKRPIYPSITNFEDFIPQISIPAREAYKDILQHGRLATGFVIRDGWFKGNHLALERYVAPFIFPKKNMTLHGTGDFKGSFDENTVIVHYDAHDFLIENHDFSFDVKHLGEETTHNYAAIHVFNLIEKSNFGTIPVRQGVFFDKTSGLLFTDVHGKVYLKDGMLHVDHLEAFSNGIYFSGESTVDWSMPGVGVFSLDFHLDQATGKLSQVQHLLSHFKSHLFQFKLPIEANLSLQTKGAELHIDFTPNHTTIYSHILGTIHDGIINHTHNDLIVQDLNLNFDYNHTDNTLEISDIQAAVIVGSTTHFEEYFIVGDKISFTDLANNESQFDLQLIDRSKKIMRLKGGTHSEDDRIYLTLDKKLSHIGHSHFSAFHMTLKEWSQIDELQADFSFHLKTLIDDLSPFHSTGLFFLSRSLLKEINALKDPHGFFTIQLNYEGDRSVFNYHVTGSDVGIGTQQIKNFLFTGKKKGDLWSIDQFQVDELSLAADILKDGNLWSIYFLGARIGQSFLLGMEGGYRVDEAHLTAKINLLEADLSQLGEWPQLKQFVETWQLGGKLRSTGTIDALLHSLLDSGPVLNIRMKSSLDDGMILGMNVRKIENFTFEYSSENGLVLNDVQTAIKSIHDDEWQVGFYLKHGGYDLKKRELIIDNLRFLMPVNNLEWWSNHLERSFPNIITAQVAETLRQAKTAGDLEGGIHLLMSDSTTDFRLQFNDGPYHLMGKEYHLSQFIINYDSKKLSVSAEHPYNNKTYKILLQSTSSDLKEGEVIFSDFSSRKNTSVSPLKIHWQRSIENGFVVEKIEGECSGISCALQRDLQYPISPNQLFLNGKIDIDMSEAENLLDPSLKNHISAWKLGPGYSLQGQWIMDKDDTKAINERLWFDGEFLGQNFVLLGYRLQHLFSFLQFSPESIHIDHLECTDPCGSAQIESLVCWKLKENKWQLLIPSFSMHEFRPSLLRQADSPTPPQAKALVIRSLEIHDFTGALGAKENFTGYGSLFFANPPKRQFQSTIFAIPAEILTRIGLDFSLLDPVRGQIDYQIRNGRAELTNFKDVYSKGQLSKFYLSKSGSPSYVDFDGNLQMQIRMKQYNLILKLAELFTVTVQGTLNKPTYSLQKQPRK